MTFWNIWQKNLRPHVCSWVLWRDIWKSQEDLANSIYVGRDEYLKTLQGFYELLLNTQNDLASQNRRHVWRCGRGRGATFSFAQGRWQQAQGLDNPVPGINGVTHKHIRCYSSKNSGHCADSHPGSDVNEMRAVDQTGSAEAERPMVNALQTDLEVPGAQVPINKNEQADFQCKQVPDIITKNRGFH